MEKSLGAGKAAQSSCPPAGNAIDTALESCYSSDADIVSEQLIRTLSHLPEEVLS